MGRGAGAPGNRSFPTPTSHRLQFVLKILVLGPNDADGHQARPGGPWGLWERRGGFSPRCSPLTAPQPPHASALSTHRPSDHDVVCLHGLCRAGGRGGAVVRGWEEVAQEVTHRFLAQV